MLCNSYLTDAHIAFISFKVKISLVEVLELDKLDLNIEADDENDGTSM